MNRPEVHRYHDYRVFLQDWLAYLKASQSGFSLRILAKETGLASGYLPMVLSGKRALSGKALSKLLPGLGLSRGEKSYFELMVTLGTTDSQKVRLETLDRMKRFAAYQRSNPKETEVYDYLSRWYNVAIRELALLPDFEADAAWIQGRLKKPLPIPEIKAALDFLLSNGFLKLSADGKAQLPEKDLECMGGVYKIALGQFHRSLLGLAADSIDETPSDERRILGHTFTVSPAQYDQACGILDEAFGKLRKLSEIQEGDQLYHAEFAFFPLTRKRSKKS